MVRWLDKGTGEGIEDEGIEQIEDKGIMDGWTDGKMNG